MLGTLGHYVPGGTCSGHAIHFFFLELPESQLYIFSTALTILYRKNETFKLDKYIGFPLENNENQTLLKLKLPPDSHGLRESPQFKTHFTKA